MISYVKAAKIVKENNIETGKDCYKYASRNYTKYNIDSIQEARSFAGALELVVNSNSSPKEIIKRNKLKAQKRRIQEVQPRE